MAQPDRLHPAGLVADGGAHALQPARQLVDLEMLESADDAGFVDEEQVADRLRGRIGDVPGGVVEEQIAHVHQTEPLEQARALGPDALQGADLGVEVDARRRRERRGPGGCRCRGRCAAGCRRRGGAGPVGRVARLVEQCPGRCQPGRAFRIRQTGVVVEERLRLGDPFVGHGARQVAHEACQAADDHLVAVAIARLGAQDAQPLFELAGRGVTRQGASPPRTHQGRRGRRAPRRSRRERCAAAGSAAATDVRALPRSSEPRHS